MKIQTRLYVINTIFFALLFSVMMGSIAFVFYTKSKASIYNLLKNTSYISALFYLEEDEMNFAEFEVIKHNFDTEVFNQFYQFYNSENKIEFGAESPLIDTTYLAIIRETGKLAFEDEYFFCYGIFYKDNQGDFVVIAKEKKEVLYTQIYSLLLIMSVMLLLSIIIILLVNRRIAKYAYRPFRTVISQVNHLDANSPNLQISQTNTKDELEDLIKTFNQLLSQVSDTLVIQRNFVRFVSHEFKTPLTAMLGNLEVSLLKDRTSDEYKKVSQILIEEIHYLEDTLNTLIFLSDVNLRVNESQTYRLDDLIWEVIEKIKVTHQDSPPNFEVDMQIGDSESLVIKNTNYNQIFVALYNIVDNGVKYSQSKRINIVFHSNEDVLILDIVDDGRGIPKKQLENISKPFFRANNTKDVSGSGIGLSLAIRLLEKNGIRFEIESDTAKGTKVSLYFRIEEF